MWHFPALLLLEASQIRLAEKKYFLALDTL
jgi:hypothetical protein